MKTWQILPITCAGGAGWGMLCAFAVRNEIACYALATVGGIAIGWFGIAVLRERQR